MFTLFWGVLITSFIVNGKPSYMKVRFRSVISITLALANPEVIF